MRGAGTPPRGRRRRAERPQAVTGLERNAPWWKNPDRFYDRGIYALCTLMVCVAGIFIAALTTDWL